MRNLLGLRLSAAPFGVMMLAAVLLLTACKDKPTELAPDPEFSINVMAVPVDWPREELDWPDNPTLRRTQQEAWARYGTPDFIRFIYTMDRRIVKPSEAIEGHRMAGKFTEQEQEWVYLADEIVLRFKGAETIERPLDDILRTVVMYGDPNEIKRWPELGVERTSFTYYDAGKTFNFSGNSLSDVYEFTPMPGFNMRD
ncbi:hypothetical protein KQI84_14900 [bacterium]|nr:hypothetical protein [bacterium]